MKKHLLFLISTLFVFSLSFGQENVDKNKKKSNKTTKNAIATNSTLTKRQVKELRKKHAKFIADNPFKKTFYMSKDDRKLAGLPPNKYFEQEWLLRIDPSTGRNNGQYLDVIRQQLASERAAMLQAGRVPGSDNSWVERGPNNVGGRTRAIIFDPTDATGNTVIAGGVSGGLWKNTNISNAGSSWTMITTLPEHLNVQNITIDPINSSTWYVGTGESYVAGDVNGNGVWKTTNAGLTWTRVFGGGTVTTTPSSTYNLEIISPSNGAVIGNYSTGKANFGPALTNMTAPIVLINDGTAPDVTDACEAAVGSLTGKIVLIRRGTCSFESKVVKAQNAGAVGVIIMNNVAGAGAVGMADDGAETATIPSLMVSKEDGDLLVANLTNLTGTFKPTLPGDFTGTIVEGVQLINDIAIKNNGGTSNIYVALGDGIYAEARNNSLFSPQTYGVYKSTDGGATWTKLNLPLSPSSNQTCPNDIEIGADGKIWVSSTDSWTFGDGGGRVFSSSDDGVTFVTKHTVTGNGGGTRVEIETSATNANKIYVLSELAQATATPTIEVKIEVTTDGFATAPAVRTLPSDTDSRSATYGFTGAQAFYNLFIEADPTDDAKVYVGGLNLHKSTNSGTSWTQISNWSGGNFVHSDQHAMVFKPGNTDVALFGNDGGVYYAPSLSGSTSTSANITSRNSGFNVTQFVGMGVMPLGVSGANADFFVAGAQDNGSQYFSGSTSVATSTTGATAGVNGSYEVQGGDGGKAVFAQDSDKYYITTYVYNDNIRLRNIGSTTTRSLLPTVVPNGDKNMGLFYPAFALDSNLDLLYTDFTGVGTGTTTLYQIRRYANIKSGTVTRTILSDANLFKSYPTALKVSPYTTASSTLYAGLMNGKLLKITNANATPTFTDITGPSFLGSISDIEFGSTEQQIFVTMFNYGVTNIWYTSNGGTTWSSIEGNLPNLPVTCIVQNPLRTSELLIGTDLGTWYTDGFNPASTGNQALSWSQSYNGMSSVKVTDLDIQPNSPTAPTAYKVYAATYGRGVFSGDLTAALSSEDVAISKGIKIYPNPSNGVLNVSIANFSSKLTVEIFDINGRRVFSEEGDFTTQKSLNLSNLQSGVYVVKLQGENLNYSEKIVINK